GGAQSALGSGAAIVDAEGAAGLCTEDTGDIPAAEYGAGDSAAIAQPRNIPDAGDGEAVADVVGGTAAIARRLEGILEPETEVAFKERIGEEGALIVDRVREGVAAEEGQAGFGKLLCFHVDLQSVVA